MADLTKNLTRLRALSYKLGTIKHTIDCIIARLEAKPSSRFDYDDFYDTYTRHLDGDVDSLKDMAGHAMSEVKGYL